MYLDAIQVATQFFEDLKTTVLQIEDNLYNLFDKLRLQEQKESLPILFLNLETSPCRYCKNSGLRKQRSFLEELSFFLCALRYKSSLGTESHFFEKQTLGIILIRRKKTKGNLFGN